MSTLGARKAWRLIYNKTPPKTRHRPNMTMDQTLLNPAINIKIETKVSGNPRAMMTKKLRTR
jgi:hypothetical protein